MNATRYHVCAGLAGGLPLVPDPAATGRAHEPLEVTGWKDTLRVDPGNLVSVAIRFDRPGRDGGGHHHRPAPHRPRCPLVPSEGAPVQVGMPTTRAGGAPRSPLPPGSGPPARLGWGP